VEFAVKHASFLDAVKTVLSGAVGIRRKAAHEEAKINPLHIVIVAVVFVALFILAIVTLVQVVTS
jgi:DUF2970 family protein